VYFWGALPGMTLEQTVANVRMIGEQVAPLLRAAAGRAPS